nr:immunoglobulin heavy chain junction region [Macaca mulatta]MOV41416.1 immunoglobulin heavy chain junction region [Macaca mulatta]MOV41786.1 immunoglobulin heavy chain junction region [Macaca mulatta]MOV42643.1 immunoglobulin heavy chain junction region [Macaca mulatta]MOV43130.1 immunoglobulin heavy chain junction region [Macaca mulatta]
CARDGLESLDWLFSAYGFDSW